MAKLLHIFYHKEGTFSLLCQQVHDYSILSGESGTILTLINGIYLGKEYPKLLMID